MDRVLILTLVLKERGPSDVDTELAESISEVFEVQHTFVIVRICLSLLYECSKLLIGFVHVALVLLFDMLDLCVHRYRLFGLKTLCLHSLDLFDDSTELLFKEH